LIFYRLAVSDEAGGSKTPQSWVRTNVRRWPGINRSAACGSHCNQEVSQTDGVLSDKAEFPQAIMAGGAVACVNDAFAFDVVLQ
jgi:hypothetical protein